MCSLPILMIYLEQTLAILSVNIKDAIKLKTTSGPTHFV